MRSTALPVTEKPAFLHAGIVSFGVPSQTRPDRDAKLIAKSNSVKASRGMNEPPNISRTAEGQRVCIGLRDGTRFQPCELASTGANKTATLWLVIDDEDVFVPVKDVVELRVERPDPYLPAA